MKSKLILFTAVIILLSFAAQAQKKNDRKKITFGVRAGVNFQTANWEDIMGEEKDTRLATRFHAGVNAEIPVGQKFYIQPGVLYSNKGTRTKNSNKVSINYIEVPLNLLYKGKLGIGKILVGAGPYVALGISGKVKYSHSGAEQDIEWLKDFEGGRREYMASPLKLRRFDAGTNVLAGYEFNNKFSVQLNAQLGMVNIHSTLGGRHGNSRFENIGFGASAGYRF